MSQNIWTLYEDCALNILIEEKKNKRTKWSQISKILESQYGVFGKTAKDCRERWQNKTENDNRKDEWTDQEKKFLYGYHNQYGNKWSKMAQVIKRSDNCIKNYFYSTTRRSMRKLNKYIVDKKIRNLKDLKNSFLSKVLSTAEQKFSSKCQNYPNHVIQNCIMIKNILLTFQKMIENQGLPQSKMKQIIQILSDLRSSFNKKNKKKVKELVVNSQINNCQKNVQIKNGYDFQIDEYPTIASQNFQTKKLQEIYIPFSRNQNQQKQIWQLIQLSGQQNEHNYQKFGDLDFYENKGRSVSYFDEFFEPDFLMHQI